MCLFELSKELFFHLNFKSKYGKIIRKLETMSSTKTNLSNLLFCPNFLNKNEMHSNFREMGKYL